MAASTDDYVALLTGEHRNKQNFVAVVRALTAGPSDLINVEQGLVQNFDLDQAIGVQLDQDGLWIGAARTLDAPLPTTYFAFDTFGVGWDEGTWYEDGQPVSGLTVLDDTAYRTLLKSKIGANQWDGTLPSLIAIMQAVFAGTSTNVFASDEQNMSMTVGLSGALPTPVQIALLRGGYLVPKPMGVHVNYFTTTVDGAPLFGWDVENTYIQGWDEGAWGAQT